MPAVPVFGYTLDLEKLFISTSQKPTMDEIARVLASLMYADNCAPRDKIGRLRQDQARLRMLVRASQQALTASDATRAALERRLTESETSHATLWRRLERCEAENAALAKRLEMSARNSEALWRQLHQRSLENQTLYHQLKAAHQKNDALWDRVVDMEKEKGDARVADKRRRSGEAGESIK